MNLIRVESDSSFSRDTRSGAIVNTSVDEFHTAMERKAAREEYLNDLQLKHSALEEQVNRMSEILNKLLKERT